MDPIVLKLNIAEPVRLKLKVDTGYVVVPEQVPASEPLFLGSEAAKFASGDKNRIDDALAVSLRLGEFDTEQKKWEARQNLDINIIDGGTFN